MGLNMMCGFSKEFVDYYELNEEAKNSIPSRFMKAYLDSDEYWDCFISNRDKGWNSYPTWSCLQLLTIAYNFMSSRKRVRFIRRIAEEMDCSPEEKTFMRMCACDLAKNKYRGKITCRTLSFYDRHFYKQYGAVFPLEQLLFLPVTFKPGDVVVFRRRKKKSEYYLVIGCPNYEAGFFKDFSDESYVVLNLKGGKELLDEKRFYSWHNHLDPGQLELIPEGFSPGKYRKLIERLRGEDFIRKRFGRTYNNLVGLHTKEEMRIRLLKRIEEQERKRHE